MFGDEGFEVELLEEAPGLVGVNGEQIALLLVGAHGDGGS